MARFLPAARTLSLSGTTTFTYAFTGGLITIGGATGYTVTLVNPAYAPGQVQNFYNATSGNITLATPNGNITGPGLTAATTQLIPTTAVFSVTSDGTNYILTNNHGGPVYGTTGTLTSTLAVTTSTTTPIVQGSTLGSTTLTLRSTSSSTKATAGVLMDDGIASSSNTTGTLVVTGGLGVSGNVNFGGTATGTLSSSNATLTGGSINNMAIGGSTRASANFTSIDANSTVGLSPSNASVTISPTGTGTVTMSPGTTGNINNVNIGGTTRAAGSFTTLAANSTVTLTPSNASVTISPTGSGNVVMSPATSGTIDNIAIGNTTRAGGSFTVLNANNTVSFTAGSSASSTTTGTMRVTGGVGISENLYVGGLAAYNMPMTTQGGSYTLALTDQGKIVNMNGSGVTVTIPNDSSVNFPTGAWVYIYKGSTNTCTLAAAGGVSLSATGTLVNYEVLKVIKTGSNTWIVQHAAQAGKFAMSGGTDGGTTGTYRVRIFYSGDTATVS